MSCCCPTSIYDPVTNVPDIQVVTTLSALAIITANSDLLEASLAEILKLPIDQRVASDPTKDSYYLLACEKILSGSGPAGAVEVFSHALHDDVTSSKAQHELADALEAARSPDGGDEEGSAARARDVGHLVHSRPWELDRWDHLTESS